MFTRYDIKADKCNLLTDLKHPFNYKLHIYRTTASNIHLSPGTDN